MGEFHPFRPARPLSKTAPARLFNGPEPRTNKPESRSGCLRDNSVFANNFCAIGVDHVLLNEKLLRLRSSFIIAGSTMLALICSFVRSVTTELGGVDA